MPIVNGRTLDWVPRFDPESKLYSVRGLLAGAATATPSAYDKVQDARYKALLARVTKIEGEVVPPTPVPPSPVPPGPPPTPTPTPPNPTPPPPPPPPPAPAAILWDCPVNLDQQQTGMCVGYGWTDDIQSAPTSEKIVPGHGGDDPSSTPAAIYFLAQQIGGQPKDDQAGTSVLDGAKAAKQLGFITAYHWALSLGDVVAAVEQLGPVVVGIPWTNDMFNPDAKGLIHATGAVAGGHCLIVRGVSADQKTLRLRNSWGASWGVGGDALIAASDLEALLAQQGEAAVPTKP